MSELQDKLDRGEITLEGYHASWITQNGRKPAARPRRHDQLYEYLIAKYPDPSVEADAFFALEESDGVSTKEPAAGPSANSQTG